MCNCKNKAKTTVAGQLEPVVVETTKKRTKKLKAEEIPVIDTTTEPIVESTDTPNFVDNQLVIDILRAKDFLNLRVINETEKVWFMNFVNSNLGESVVGYCDVICKTRIRAKLDKLQNSITR
jgi:hypothetical protein